MTDAQPTTDVYDVIVIGGGPVGENAADYAIRGSGLSAVLIEDQLVGGECSYWACMPSKALLGGGAALDHAAGLPGSRPQLRTDSPDLSATLAWRDSMTHERDDSSQVDWATGAGIDVIRGRGRLVGERTIEVDGRLIRATHAVVLATGSTAVIPPIPGLATALPWTSRDATNLVEVPDRIVVLGGGVVACEAATWLADLGSSVTMLVRGASLLPAMEPFVGELVAEGLREQGIDVRLQSTIAAATRPDARPTGYGHIHGGPVHVQVSDIHGNTTVHLDAEELLVAAGRRPATDDLGLDALGIDPTAPLDVDDHLSVANHPWLYAVGDVNGRAPLTHMGKYQARVAGDVIAARASGADLTAERFTARADHTAVPQVVFTRPEVASVGLTEQSARNAGLDVQTSVLDIAVAGSALVSENYRGRAELVIDRARNTVVGATFVGPEVGELVHSATIAIVGEVPIERLWHAVPSYPTVSEVWLRLLEQLRPT